MYCVLVGDGFCDVVARCFRLRVVSYLDTHVFPDIGHVVDLSVVGHDLFPVRYCARDEGTTIRLRDAWCDDKQYRLAKFKPRATQPRDTPTTEPANIVGEGLDLGILAVLL